MVNTTVIMVNLFYETPSYLYSVKFNKNTDSNEYSRKQVF